MTHFARLIHLALCLLLPASIAHAEWRPVERIETYRISGQTGGELYASIGKNGPKLGGRVGAIAHTSFKLKWTRKYVPQNGGCTLVSAVPKLTILYTLPKPTTKFSTAMGQNWQTFIDGVRDHEKVHGRMIVDMVKEIEATSIGLSVPSDPDCQAIRKELTRRLAEISRKQRQLSRDFDRLELSDGANIHQLILRLVNGG